MPFIFTVGAAVAIITYLSLQLLLYATQDAREPRLAESQLPFLDSVVGIAKQRAEYLVGLRYVI